MKNEKRHLHSPVIPFKYDKKQLSMATDARIYRDCAMLKVGSWSDSISMSPIIYTKEALKAGSTNWKSNYLNVDHSFETRNRLGFVTSPYFKGDTVFGDLHIFPITTVSKDIIALIDADLVNWISVELTSKDDWNDDAGEMYANDIQFMGAAIVLYPAVKDGTYIKKDGPKAYN
jgi:hypothetical protein